MSVPSPQLAGDLSRGEFDELLDLAATELFAGDRERFQVAFKWTYLGMTPADAIDKAFLELHA